MKACSGDNPRIASIHALKRYSERRDPICASGKHAWVVRHGERAPQSLLGLRPIGKNETDGLTGDHSGRYDGAISER